jgi:hypothetical protein
MTPLLEAWLTAFGLTLLVEIPIFAIVARLLERGRAPRAPLWRLAIAGAAGTCLTHPLLWFVWPRLFGGYSAYVVSGELLVAAIETGTFYLVARPVRLSTAAAASFLANGASFAVGMILPV